MFYSKDFRFKSILIRVILKVLNLLTFNYFIDIMGLGDNCAPGDGHKTEYFVFYEKTRIPGFKRRIDIGIKTIESLQTRYVSGVESHVLFLGRPIHRTFYPVNSSGAKEILQKYRPEFA